MHPKPQRRVHGVEFKTAVLADCRQPGASVAAVALAHGLNVNLVRKWRSGERYGRRPVTARGVGRLLPSLFRCAGGRPLPVSQLLLMAGMRLMGG
jgi:transposase